MTTTTPLEVPARSPIRPSTPLDCAIGVGRWLRETAVPDGPRGPWPPDPGDPDRVPPFESGSPHGLYGGTAGIALFWLELAAATGDVRAPHDARTGARRLIDQLAATPSDRPDGPDPRFGLYDGVPGWLFTLLEVHRATGDAGAGDAALRALDLLHRAAVGTPDGPTWGGGPSVARGDAGVLLALLHAAERLGDPDVLATAAACGRRLVTVAEPGAGGGLRWPLAPQLHFPNFEVGTAGVGFALARLHAATGERAFGDAAAGAARHVRAVASPAGSGMLVHHHDPNGTELFYLGHCHGPPGTGKLFVQLGDLDGVRSLAEGLVASDVLERQSPGYWNVVSQCCGTAGIGEFLVTAWHLLDEPRYLDMAARLGDQIAGRATTEGGTRWYDAWSRTEPWDVRAHSGYLSGAAGVASFLLRLHGALRGDGYRPQVWPSAFPSGLPEGVGGAGTDPA